MIILGIDCAISSMGFGSWVEDMCMERNGCKGFVPVDVGIGLCRCGTDIGVLVLLGEVVRDRSSVESDLKSQGESS